MQYKNMIARQQFTVSELGIAAAIAGLMGMIALPFYQDFAVRSKVSGYLASMGPAKSRISRFVEEQGTLSGSGKGIYLDSGDSYASRSDVDPDGVINIRRSAADLGADSDVVLELRPTLTPAGTVSWLCARRFPTKPTHVPTICR